MKYHELYVDNQICMVHTYNCDNQCVTIVIRVAIATCDCKTNKMNAQFLPLKHSYHG